MNTNFTHFSKIILIAFFMQISFIGSATDYYWVGGSGIWTDLTHWATTSGGTTFHTIVPTPVDNVHFDANSFSANGQTVTINFESFCNSFVASNLGFSAVFDFNANLRASNGIDIDGDITWHQDGELTVQNGDVTLSGNTIFNMGNYNFLISDGDLLLEDVCDFNASLSWSARTFEVTNGTMLMSASTTFDYLGNGRFILGDGDLIVPSGARLDLRAHEKFINNGSFKALANSTVNLAWHHMRITNGGLEIDPASNYTQNVRFWFASTGVGGPYHIKSSGKNLQRIELTGTDYGNEYILQDDLKVSSDGVFMYANDFVSNGHEIDAYHFYSWTGGTNHIDLTGTDTVKVVSQFRIHNSANTTVDMGTATILWEGNTHMYLYAGINLVFNDLIFNPTSTGSTLINLEYPATINDITVNAPGLQYMNFHHSSTINNFTWNYSSNSITQPNLYVGGNKTFNGTFSINSSGSTRAKLRTHGNNTFNIFDIDSGIDNWELQGGSTQTITNLTPIIGSCESPILINSHSLGTQGIISQATGTVTGDYVQLLDNLAQGGATFNAINSIELGNVAGWNITAIAAADFYWIGEDGVWSDPDNWSLTSGGVAGCAVPSRIDNVIFDLNSFTASGQFANLDVPAECHDMTWIDMEPGAGMNGNQLLEIYGSIKLDGDMVNNYNGIIEMESVDAGETIETQGVTIHRMDLKGQGLTTGEWTLVDDLKTSNYLYVNTGTFNSDGNNLDLYAYRSNGCNTVVNFTNGTTLIKLQHLFDPYQATTDLGIADLLYESTNQHMYLRYAGYSCTPPIAFNNVTFNQQSTGGHQVIIEHIYNSTFKDVTINQAGSSWVRWDHGSDNNYEDVVVNHTNRGFTRLYNMRQDTFQSFHVLHTGTADYSPQFEIHSNSHSLHLGDFILTGENDITPYFWADRGFRTNSLTMANLTYFRLHPSYTYEFDDMSITSTCEYRTKIYSRTSGSQVTVLSHGPATADYVVMKDINATGSGPYTSTNGTDAGNVTGWPMGGSSNFYWIGAAGNWNDSDNWSLTSGGSPSGCIPSFADNVFFDVNSFTAPNQTVNVNGNGYCNSMVWNNVNNPIITGNELHVYGSLSLAPNLTWNNNSWLNMQSTNTGNTITTNGVQLRYIRFEGDGTYTGEWTLQDDLDVLYDMYVTRGSFVSNGNNLSVRSFFNHNANALVSIDFSGTSIINVQHRFELRNNTMFNIGSADIVFENMVSGYYRILGYSNTFNDLIFDHDDGANLIYLFNSSHNNVVNDVIINSTAYPTIQFYNNQTYNDISILFDNSTTNIPMVNFHGSNTVNVFSSTSIGNAGPYISFLNNNSFNDVAASGLGTRLLLGANKTQTVNGIIALGNGSFPVFVKSITDGTQATIYKPNGEVCLDFVLLQDIYADADPGTGSFGLATEFFAGTSSVDLSNNTNWQYNSCQAYYWVGDSGDWSDYSNHWATSSGGSFFHVSVPGPTDNIFFDGNSFTTSGSVVNVDVVNAEAHNMTWQSSLFTPTLTGNATMNIYGDLELITFMNQNFTGNWNFEADDTGNLLNTAAHEISEANFNGGLDGEGEWVLQNNLNVSGDLNFNNGKLNSNDKDISVQNFNSLTSNTRSLLLGSSDVTVTDGSWNPATLINATLDEGTSTIYITGDNTASFLGNSLDYNDVTFTTSTTSTTLNASLTGSNSFNNLQIDQGVTLTVEESTTQTMAQLIANGSCDGLIEIQSATPGMPATFSQASGTTNTSFLALSDNIGTGGASFNADFSEDNGGNTGWAFSAVPDIIITIVTGNVDCETNNDGFAEVTMVTGGTAPYSYLWSTFETTALIENLIPGTYSVTVTDASNCAVAEAVAVVNEPSGITPTPFTATAFDICLGTQIDFTAGSPPETVDSYYWDFGDFNNSTDQNPSHTYAEGGVYTVSLSYIDAFGCPTIVTDEVQVSDLQTTLTVANVDCFGNDNGSIGISASGGIEPYQYSIDNGTTYLSSESFTSLMSGSYSVIVLDDIGCSTTAQAVTITSPTSNVSFTVTSVDVSCAENEDGSITISASGGTSPYDYSINNGIFYQSSNNFTELPFGTYSVKVRDDNNCVADAQVVEIEVNDTELPTITCPANVNDIPLPGECDADVTVFSPSVDDNCAVASVVNNYNNSDDASDTYPTGTTVVRWFVTDVNGNIDSCDMNVVVTENTPPTITCTEDVMVVNDAGICGASVILTTPTADDNCELASVTNDAPAIFPVGTTMVEWTATDATGNTAVCQQNVTVTDNEDPTITCPANVTVGTDSGTCEATGVSLGSPTTSDNCPGESASNDAPASYPLGNTTVTWTVTDANGMTAQCTQTVTVEDNENPTITCPADITTNTSPGICQANVDIGVPTTNDNCGDVEISSDAKINGVRYIRLTQNLNFPINLAEFEAYQAGINIAAGATVSQSGTGSFPNSNFTDGDLNTIMHTTDLLGSWVEVDLGSEQSIESIRIHNRGDCCQNRAESLTLEYKDASNNVISSNSDFDVYEGVNGPHFVNDYARTYDLGDNIVTWTVEDSAGNTTTCTQTITVEDNEDPVITCPADMTLNTDSGECFATLTYTEPVGTDNCLGATTTLISGWGSGGTPPIGTDNVTWVVEDGSGNTDTCTFTVTVIDNEAPVADCVDFTIDMNAGLSVSVTASDIHGTSTDNCDTNLDVVIIDGQTTYNCDDIGNSYDVTLQVTDDAGLTNTCIASVTVSDTNSECNAAPVAICQDITVDADSGCEGTANAEDFDNDITPSNDPDAGDVITYSVLPIGPYALGTTPVVLTVTDQDGLFSTCDATITVEDNEDPTITCPNDINLSCISDVPDAAILEGFDNCDSDPVVDFTEDVVVINANDHLITRTWTVTDAAGNSTSCSQMITVEDNENPTITCPADVVSNSDLGTCEAILDIEMPIVDDNCPRVFGEALDLDGNNDYVNVPHHAGLNFGTGDYTLECWIKSTDTGFGGLITKRAIGNNSQMSFATKPDGKVEWALGLPGGLIRSDDPINDDVWHHVAVVRDGGTMLMYVDGVVQAETATSTGNYDNTNDLVIGRYYYNSSQHYTDGAIDEVRIWNIARTLPEIESTRFVPLSGSESGLVGYYNLNEGSGTTAIDFVSGNNGSILNGPGWTDGPGGLSVTNDITNTSDASGIYPIGTTMVTWTVTDAAGNSTSCIQSVTVEDNEDPVLTGCPADMTVECDNIPTAATVTATDNCDAGVVVIYDESFSNYLTTNDYTITRTWTSSDESGNSTSCTQIITVEDTTDPVLVGCPADITVECDVVPDAAIVITTDNCDAGVTVTFVEVRTDGASNDEYTLDRTWTATDESGNTTSCTQIVTVDDTTNPEITCPSDITEIATSAAGAVATYTDPVGTDNCSAMTTQIAGLPSGSTFPIGTTTNTFEVTDDAGNTATCSFDVTVSGLLPDIICPADIVVSNDAGLCEAIITFAAAESTGIPASVITYSQDSGTVFPLGTTTVTAIATNAVGADTCTFTVTVEDNEAPNAICQDITVQLDVTGNASITANDIDNGSNDACGIDSIVLNKTDFDCSDIGFSSSYGLDFSGGFGHVDATNMNFATNSDYTMMGWLKTTVAGHQGIFDGKINLAHQGSSIYVELQSSGLLRFLHRPNGSAGGGTNLYSTTPVVSGTWVHFAAVKGADDKMRWYINGVLEGTSAVVIDIPTTLDMVFGANIPASRYYNGQLDQVSFWNTGLSHADVLTYMTNGVIGTEPGLAHYYDFEDGPGSPTLTDLTGSSDGTLVNMDINNDWVIGTAGAQDGVNVTLTVTDNNGNVSNCNATVTVEDNVAPVANCQDLTAYLDASGNVSIEADQIDNASNRSSDACGIDTLLLSMYDFTCTNVGGNTVDLIAVDVNGNMDTCSATVTILDTIAPIAICQDITVALDAIGEAGIVPADIDGGSSDACGIQSITASIDSFDCSMMGRNDVTLTVTDVNGNISTCVAEVEIIDTILPIVVCQDITVQLDASGNATITADDIDNGSNDACGILSLEIDSTAFTCQNIGANTVVLTVTDNNGNVNTCSATATIEDNVDPTAICQDLTIQLDANGNASITVDDVNNGSNDACGIDTIYIDNGIFTCAEEGANTVTLTVVDNNGNSSTCTSTITVEDEVAPVAICQDITVQLDASGNASITANDIDNGSNDACGIQSITLDDYDFDCNDVGADVAANAYAIDIDGVNDWIDATGNGGAKASATSLGLPVQEITLEAYINVKTFGIWKSMVSFIQDNGSFERGWDLETYSGNRFAFTLNSVGGGGGLTYMPTTNAFNLNQWYHIAGVYDGTTMKIYVDGVLENTSTAENGDIWYADSWLAMGMYKDDNENNSLISVIDEIRIWDVAKTQAEIQAGMTSTLSGNESGLVAYYPFEDGPGSPIASDHGPNGLDGTLVNMDPATDWIGGSTASGQGGGALVTMTVTDNNGNTSTCAANVTIEDNIDPVAICQDLTIQLNASGNASITADDVDNGSNDACGIESLEIDIAALDCSNVGPNTVTLTVTDVNGNTSTCQSTVTVEDNVDPIVICQDITVQLDASGDATITANDVDNGSSDACGIQSLVLNETTFDCNDIGANPVTLTVTDNNGNVVTCNATVTIEDNVDPTAICQDLTVQLDAFGNTTITSAMIDDGSSDACGIDSMTLDITTFDCSNVGTNPVVLTVVDNNGNVSTCNSTITIEDNVDPVALCQNVTVVLDNLGNGSINVNDVDNGSNDACGIQSITLDETDFTCADVGDNTVILTVTDNNNNVSTCTSTISVVDNVAPIALCQNITIELDANGEVSITPADIDNGSNDACGLQPLSVNVSDFDCSNVGPNTVILTVTDVNGNVSTCESTVTVEDNEAPTFSQCPLDQTVEAVVGDCSQIVSWLIPSVDDNCGAAAPVFSAPGVNILEFGPSALGLFQVGTTTVTMTVTDDNNNVSTCTFDITVEDTQAPIITNCPTDITVNADSGSCDATITYPGVIVASDNCPGVILDAVSGHNIAVGTFPVGTTNVLFRATDAVGLITECAYTVTVIDAELPVVTCQDVTVSLDALGDGMITANDVFEGVTDNCDINMSSLAVDISSFDCSNVGDVTVTVSIEDIYGNVGTCTATVTVIDEVDPEALCNNITVDLDANGEATITAAQVDGGSNDACGIQSVTIDNDSFDCNDTGANDVTLTVTDNNGNVSTCTSIVTVQDVELPSIVCPGNISVNNDTLACGAIVDFTATAADNCEAVITYSKNPGTFFSVGTTTVIATATDPSGNEITCSFDVTVIDNEVPYIDCPADITIDANDGACSVSGLLFPTLNYSDNCEIASFTNNMQSSYPVGVNELEIVLEDIHGNVTTCVQLITVVDNQAPEVVCNDITIDLPNRNDYTLSQADINAIGLGSSDNCTDISLTITDGVTTYNCDDRGETFSVTLTVTDNAGNVSTCTANISIIDSQSVCNDPPMALCQDITVNTGEDCTATITAEQVDGGSTDPDGDDLTLNLDNYGPFGVGVHEVSLFTTDGEFIDTCTALVTVQDITPPTVICQDLTIQLDENGEAYVGVLEVDNGSSDACGIFSLSTDIKDFDCSMIGENTVTLTVLDINGNSASCTSTITIEDNIAPVAICQDITVQLDASGNVSITTDDVDGGSNDACGIQSLSIDDDSFDCSDIGEIGQQVILTVTDNNGNTSICDATVTVEDNVAPEIECLDITVQLDASGTVTIVPDDIASGPADCSGTVTLYSGLNYTGNSITLSAGIHDFPALNSTVGNDQTRSVKVNGAVTVELWEHYTPYNGQTNIGNHIVISADTPNLPFGGTSSAAVFCSNGGTPYDACGIDTQSIDVSTFTCASIGDNAVTLTVTDVNGNVSTCQSTVTVEDNVDPIAICQDITVQLDAGGNVSIVAADVDNGSNDACGIQSLTIDDDSFGCADVGGNTVTLTVTDNNGNVSMCTSTVTVEDNVDPQAVCQDITVQLDALGNATITAADVDGGSNDACGIDNLLIDINSFGCADVGPNTVTLTAIDNNGNQSTCEAIVNVEDNVAPVAICQDITIQLDASGEALITPNDIDNGSNVACGIDSLSINQSEFNCFHVGDNTVTLTVTDNNGNVSTCTSTVTVEDNVDPIAICQDITIQLNASGMASISANDVDNGSNDACGISSLSIDMEDFNCSHVGANTVTLTVTDNNGNVSNCTSTVTVEDNVDPIALCQNLTVQLDASGNASITAGEIDNGSNDACGIQSLTIDNDSFGCANVGANTVTLTVTDNNGNVSTCTSTVTVQDNVDPLAICQDITIQLDANGTASITSADIDNGSNDACGIQSLTINDDSFGCADVGTNTVTLTVIDNNGNVSTCTSTVTVEDNVDPVAVCQDITVQLDASGDVSITASDVDGGSSDACGINNLSIDNDNFGCADVGANTVTLTIMDNNGNESICTATVTVEDMVAPIAVCQDITVQLDALGDVNISSNDVDGGSSDACGIENLSIDMDNFGCANVGNNTVILTVTDVNGNVSDCAATVTVEDNVNPVIDIAASNMTVECDGAGNTATIAAWLAANANAEASDACGITWSNDYATLSNDCGATGSTTVTFTATDDNGNSISTSAIFTIEDTTAPDMTCPSDMMTCADQGLVTGAIVTWAPVSSTDVCGAVTITSTHNSGDVFPVGITAVTYTATDDCGNPTTCSFDVTVYELPEVTISESEQPIYCQSDGILLTANATSNVGSVSYTWSTGEDTETIEVNTSGSYSVIVTDSNGCTRETNYTASIDQQNLLAAYTILAEDEAKLTHSSQVLNGGVGVYSFGGHAKVFTASQVTAPTTFVKADVIQVLSGGSVTNSISDPVSVSLPPFLNHNMSSGSNVVVSSGNTITLTGQVYGDIRVKSGGTVIFTQKDIFIDRFDVDNYATVEFEDCAFVRVDERLDIDRYTSVNPSNQQVWFYVGDNADVDRGSTVNASIYAPGSNITVKGTSSDPVHMNGQFIARKVQGLNNVYWDYSTACDPGCVPENPITEPCEITGEDTSEEWIESISLNGTSNTSGNDGGYADYTNVVLPIVTGNNSVTLTPGFSGSPYGEYWSIWIDLNNDGDFDDYQESMFSQASSSTINGSFNIPNWATSDTTTMRVAMKYGGWPWACESFEYGEVEDYSVVIDFCHNVVNGGSIGEDQVLCELEDDPTEITNMTSANGGSGAIEYLWLSNTTSGNVLPTLSNMNGWVMIPNSNNASYDPGPITETTWYLRCARREGCIDYLGESNVVEVQYTSTCQIIYCDSYGNNSNYEWIEEVSFNNDTYTSGNDGGYGDYRSTIVPLTTGINAVELIPGFASSSYHEYWTIWIDLNADGDFEDAGEEIFNGHGTNLVSGNMDIPLTAVTETTMRISMKYDGWSGPCEVFQYGEVEDYSVSISFCDNITDGGEIGTSTTLCGEDDDPSEISSIIDVDGGSGNIEYVWLYNTTTSVLPTFNNPNGWVEIPNSNTPTYDPGPITQTTCYLRCARREGCLNFTGESNVVTMTYAPSCQLEYCDSEGQSTAYEWIQKVKIGSINNNSGDNNGYADYRNLSTSIAKGSSKTITLTPGFSGSKYKEYWRVWVDWNQDGDFDDAGEQEVQKASKNAISKTISVPNNAVSGTTAMRVSMKYGEYADPCEVFGEGEVEDYSINVVNYIDEEDGDIETRDLAIEEDLEEQLPLSLEVYPNPTRGMMKVDFENSKSESMNLVIIDSRGQTIRTNVYDIHRTRTLELDITELPSGLYQLVMNFGDEVISKKIIKVD